ncbi:SigE family RNA polymerase sigma factor [Desertihabitans brevis]|uniref:SigE family RNA polymerase sigma factor n=1 Tax=Desertihabitans brevis TaxID=2268447 RepID=A0A367YT19_9ACTN|nr:SigE family RNA polymerase sigma factor [Desertihabitans brevis]RCK68172.1 SigE family RNA polymerase sigma factor [Desertihabitans brevis]
MDSEEFDVLYRTSFGSLVAQVYAMCGNRAEAQDCVQEAFIRAWDKRHTLDRASSPEGWLRTTAYRIAVSRWRRSRLARRAPDRALQQERAVEPPDIESVALTRALQRLPVEQRRVIVLHHLADLPVAEVAREVGAPEGTVKARLSRGRAALAHLLSESERSEHR